MTTKRGNGCSPQRLGFYGPLLEVSRDGDALNPVDGLRNLERRCPNGTAIAALIPSKVRKRAKMVRSHAQTGSSHGFIHRMGVTMWTRDQKLALGCFLVAFVGLLQVHELRTLLGLSDPATVQSNPRPQDPKPRPSQPPAAPQTKADRPHEKPPSEIASPPVDRRTEFIHFINSGLRLSPTQPNAGFLIASHAEAGSSSSNDIMQSVMGNPTKLNIIGNIADVRGLVSGGFFDDLYEGSSDLLRIAAQRSGVDYIIVMKAAQSFHSNPSLDQSMIVCKLNVAARLYDKSGTRLGAAGVAGAGPGFSRSSALERAVQHVSAQIQEQLLMFIPPRNG